MIDRGAILEVKNLLNLKFQKIKLHQKLLE